MFDWFWEFLYMISKTIFRLIDGLIRCANTLCGIDTVNFDGEDTDFMTYLFFSDEIGFAFRISALIATILVIIFTVFMIIRSIAKDKAEGTPAQIAIKAFKTLLMFFFVPAVMIAFTTLGNTLVNALYTATAQTAAAPGAFLFSVFAREGGMSEQYVELFRVGDLDYYSTSVVSTYMSIGEFPFVFSWLAGGVALFGIASAMLIFVDRVLSLVILYIASPISISTSVIDDGARFKLWRDQFLAKFIMGYGMILAINIYALVCNLVTKPEFTFFSGTGSSVGFLDLIMKLLIIGGGALTMQKSMALIGNLVSAGAGSNELRDSMSAGAIAKTLYGGAKSVAGTAFGIGKAVLTRNHPARILGSIWDDAMAMQSRHLGAKFLTALHMDGGKGNYHDKKNDKESNDSDSKNNDKAEYGSEDKTKNAFKQSFGGDNTNSNSSNKKDGAVGKAIEGSSNSGNKGSNNQGSQNNTSSQPQQQKEEGNNK